MPPRSRRTNDKKPIPEKSPSAIQVKVPNISKKTWKKLGAFTVALITLLAGLVSILEYFNFSPQRYFSGNVIFSPTPTLIPIPSVTFVPLSEEQKEVWAVIEAEVDAATHAKFAILESLYASNPIVIDRRGTPLDDSDDRRLVGWDEIIQKHYVGLKIYLNPESMILTNPEISISGDIAYVTHRGVIRDNRYFQDFSFFKLQKINGKWLIVQMEFNNIGNPPIAQQTGIPMFTQSPISPALLTPTSKGN